MRYTLPYELEQAGFIATPFSFFHARLNIVVEYRRFTGRQAKDRNWIVSVDGMQLTKRNRHTRNSHARSLRRFVDPVNAADEGLRQAGVYRPNVQRNHKIRGLKR